MRPEDDHPLRFALVNELHARPSPRLTVPCHAIFLAFKEPRDAANRDRAQDVAHLDDLARRYGAPHPDQGASHYSAMLGRHSLRWESHTEFVTYAAFGEGLPARPFDPASAAIFPEEWQARAPGKRIAAVQVQVEPLPEKPAAIDEKLTQWFARDGLAVVWVLEEAAVVASDFRIDPNGWMRFAVFVRPGTGQGRVGRIVQRLTELETYRAMSMLALPRSRELASRLNALDPRLSAMVEAMTDNHRPAEDTLRDLLDVSAGLEKLATQYAFRFGATHAYEAIVDDRVRALRESRFMGRQTLSEFMARRYAPAMRTVRSTEARMQVMSERVARAGELLQTRVDVERSEQNQALLERMDRRADLQLRLQHTVEGLSVVAISYYAIGLLSYALTPLAKLVHLDKTLLIALAVPLVVVCVWLAMNRIKARIHKDAGSEH